MKERFEKEKKEIAKGVFQGDLAEPNLYGGSRSLSPYIRFGCLSVRLFFHSIMNLYREELQITPALVDHKPSSLSAQLIWREYFYTMSLNNEKFAEVEGNSLCLPIPWKEDEAGLKAWKEGKTGFPWIDALQRQLILEGWTHHVGRHAAATFLTRGDLWVSWVPGAQHFIRYQIDGDWAVGIGNWMWVSSSAFEKALDCTRCMCPINYGRRMDPQGKFTKKYIPELRNYPLRYLFNPWAAPAHIQKEAGCIIGEDYPAPLVDHKFVSKRNQRWMQEFKDSYIDRVADHIRPTTYSEEELKMCGIDTHSENCKSCLKRRRVEESEDSQMEDDFYMEMD